jgi:hypothetical protein
VNPSLEARARHPWRATPPAAGVTNHDGNPQRRFRSAQSESRGLGRRESNVDATAAKHSAALNQSPFDQTLFGARRRRRRRI